MRPEIVGAAEAAAPRRPRFNPKRVKNYLLVPTDAPYRSAVIEIMERLGAVGTTLPRSAIVYAAEVTVYGGIVSSMSEQTGLPIAEAKAKAIEATIAFLQEEGVIADEAGMVTLLKDEVWVPTLAGDDYGGWADYERARPYRLGDKARAQAAHETHVAVRDAWQTILFEGRKRATAAETVWTAPKIYEALESMRGAVDPFAVELLEVSMLKDGFWPHQPILRWRDSHGAEIILDGRHRKQAASSLGLDPIYTEIDVRDMDQLLTYLVRMDEAGKSWTEETASNARSAFYEVGLDYDAYTSEALLEAIREHKRVQTRKRVQEHRERKEKGIPAGPRGPKANPGVTKLAEEIASLLASGEKVNVAARAKVAGLSATTLRDAVKRAQERRHCYGNNVVVSESEIQDDAEPEPQKEAEAPASSNGSTESQPEAESATATVWPCEDCGRPVEDAPVLYLVAPPDPANHDRVIARYSAKKKEITDIVSGETHPSAWPRIHEGCIALWARKRKR